MAMREPPVNELCVTLEERRNFLPPSEHHHDIDELLECGMAATDRCELCEIFVVSLEWEFLGSPSILKERQPFGRTARTYREIHTRMLPQDGIHQRRLYAAEYNFHSPIPQSFRPGIALWIEDHVWVYTRIAQALFSWKKGRLCCPIFSFTG